jgi:hypothetical protein
MKTLPSLKQIVMRNPDLILQHLQQVNLQTVQFPESDPTVRAPRGVVEEPIVGEFAAQQQHDQHQAVNIKRRDREWAWTVRVHVRMQHIWKQPQSSRALVLLLPQRTTPVLDCCAMAAPGQTANGQKGLDQSLVADGSVPDQPIQVIAQGDPRNHRCVKQRKVRLILGDAHRPRCNGRVQFLQPHRYHPDQLLPCVGERPMWILFFFRLRSQHLLVPPDDTKKHNSSASCTNGVRFLSGVCVCVCEDGWVPVLHPVCLPGNDPRGGARETPTTAALL